MRDKVCDIEDMIENTGIKNTEENTERDREKEREVKQGSGSGGL